LPTITVGSVSLNQDFITAYRTQGTETAANIDRLLEMLARGDFDLVAVGRALIVNPDWPDKIRTGRAGTLKPWSPEALATLY
ncbi:MAG: 12-oxophytodienoate reductase, partial [Alphaproteobacteria bacterium]|nr:12-oxophytodienoate reductase [Alphaproteobacteria bacterium]